MQIDNDDFCTLGIIASLKADAGPDEKVIVHRGIPMRVRKNWFERLLTFERKKKEADRPCSPVQQ